MGGGTIFPDEQIVVTQPTEGDFKAFTAVCTHQGCIGRAVSPTARSTARATAAKFSIETAASVRAARHRRAAADETITVEGDAITLA